MGLLDRADEKKFISPAEEQPHELDELGKSLLDRIQRIPAGAHVPYTALSLLRAYGSFQAGTFFKLENENYLSCASVGLGIKKLSVPCSMVFTPGRASLKFFNFSPEEKQALGFLDRSMNLWCFPMDNGEPWNAVLIIQCIECQTLNLQNLSLLLDAILDIVHPITGKKMQTEPEIISETHIVVELEPEIIGGADDENAETGQQSTGIEESAETPDVISDVIVEPGQINSEDHHSLLADLEEHFQGNESLDGLIIDIPAELQDEESKGLNKIRTMTSHFAMLRLLSPGRILLLFPQSYDRELIAHRLSQSLKAQVLLTLMQKITAKPWS